MSCRLFRSLAWVTGLALHAACGSGGNAGASPSAGDPGAPSMSASPADVTQPSAQTNAESAGPPSGESAPPSAPSPSVPGVESNPALNGGVAPGAAEPAGNASGAVDGKPSEESVAPSETAPAPTFHVFLLLGQSNMAGYPKAQPADRVEDARVRVLGFDDCAATGRVTDQWDVAAPPLHECWNDGLGPGDYFAKAVLDVIPEGDTIGLVPCAISGERIETFLKQGGSRYDYIVRRARLAQDAGGVVEGILFHQGESNNGDPSWPGKVSALITDLRTDLALGEVPFLAGELLYTGDAAGHNARVNQLPSSISNAFVISANGLVVDPIDTRWNLHFGRDSQVEFGKRYARAMIAALGW